MTGPLRAHHRQNGACDIQQAEYVRVVHAAHIGIARLLDGTKQAEARIVDQNVDPAEPFNCGLNRGLRLGFVGHVQRDGKGAAE